MRLRTRAIHVLRLALAGLLLPLTAAHAAGSIPIAVAPVSVKLDVASEYAAVEVSNRGEQATGIEIEVMQVRWKDGQEVYEPTKEFVISPPAFRVQPGKGRMVRFRYLGGRGDMEGFYRLFIRQLPEDSGANQVSMVFNLGVPVFVAPVSSLPALAIGSTELRNTGNVTLSVSQVEGQSCPDGPLKLQVRLAPQQKLALKNDLSRCATGAQTDRGLIPLAKP